MLVRTSPVVVLSRTTYSDPAETDPDRRIVWSKSMGEAEGQLIEKIDAYDAATGAVFQNLTLDPSINGDCSPMAELRLTVEIVREQKAIKSAAGHDYLSHKDKWRVVGVEPAGKG